MSNRGYHGWHRKLDAKVVEWIRGHPRATTGQFEAYLRRVYGRGDLYRRFPKGLGGGQ